ncbi:MAG: stage II sporulation protein P [Clostridia bacterium]|nr:stage II sporulation protein P [Clostridia bacterium]
MRKWISIVMIAALVLTGGFTWEHWLPAVADFSLRQHRAITLRQVGIGLLKYTDPVMRNVGLYLTPEFTESLDEHFLYFTKPQQEEAPADTEDDAIKAANLSALSGTYHQISGTAVANATDFDVSALLENTVAMPEFTAGKPAVLIYHTHTTECYRNADGISNTTDESKNVVAVGEAMKKIFEAAGYQTIHITEIFNQPDFSGAYANSRAVVEQVLKENPTIQVVLDVHRDAISSNGIDYYPVTEVNGRQAAQIMLVCGTDAKGLSHPNWRQNFTYALQLSRQMGALYGQLSRPVNLRRDRFNTHFTPYTLLLEVGSAANTLDQAIYGGELTAKAMIDLWKSA